MENIIEVRDLKKSYGDLQAVKGVSFDVKGGEIFGFLGPNGAGKSTVINMLCTILKPTSGYARVNGYDILKQKEAVRKSIGIIFQENTLDEKLTAQENLRLHCQFYGMDRSIRETRINEVLTMVELEDRKKSVVETFSGGMKRRLEIARGLLHYPKVLFLDEPTVGLDPQTRAHIWEYALELKQREGITIFLTTHYMDEAEYSDRVAIIDHGLLVAIDTPEELKREVGGDVIEVTTSDNMKAKFEIEKLYSTNVTESGEELNFNVQRGDEFIADFVKTLSVPIKSINLRRPTLNDVFLKLTGRTIRDEELSQEDIMKNKLKQRRLH